MSVNYLAQFQAEILRVLPTRSVREKDAFLKLELREQAWRFLNWQSRLVHPHPRKVYKALGFDEAPMVKQNRKAVEMLLAGIAQGEVVGRHLSKDITNGYCIHSLDRKNGPDFDLLLNEWGIHHLHIVPGRSRELLYVIFLPGAAFALTVAPHGSWTSGELVETAISSWPDFRLFIPLNGIVPPRKNYSEGEHAQLRKVGLGTIYTFDSKAWISRVTLGITTALISTRLAREASRLLLCLHRATERPDYIVQQLIACSERHRIVWPERPIISVQWCCGPNRYCFGFVEETCGATVLI